jgi:signal transduction histidine kinase/ActR/RegA family two-component response regulator
MLQALQTNKLTHQAAASRVDETGEAFGAERWRWRPRRFTLLLAVVGLLVFTASVYTSLLIRDRQRALSQVSRYNVTWVTSQAALELARLEAVIGEFALAGRQGDASRVQIRFDIMANRVQVLGQGEPGELIRHTAELQAIYTEIVAAMAQADQLIDTIDQPGVPARLIALIAPLNVPMSKLAGAAHDEGGDLVAQDLKQLSALHWVFSGMLVALIVCSFGLIVVLTIHNRLLQRAHAEVGALVTHLRRAGGELTEAHEETKRAVEETQARNRILQERDVELDLRNTRFDAALNNMSQALCMVGPDDRLIVCNRPFRDLFGAPAAQAQTGASARALFRDIARAAPGDAELIERVWHEQQHLITEQRMGAFVLEGQGGNGQVGRAIAVSHQPMGDGGWVATYEDITESRLAERQLAQAQKMEAIGTLTGGMAHDFNNLLAVISLNLELLLSRAEVDRRVREPANRALQASLRGANLITQLLAFARRQPLAPQRISVNPWIGSIASLLERTLGDSVEIRLELGGDIWPVNADAIRLETAIANLATNARDAMPQGGRLTITTSNATVDEASTSERPELMPGDYVMIEVSDTGTGIPPEIMGRIFEPFFTTKQEGRGTGLGLSMVFGFIRQSGGHITVQSTAGAGTTFRLYLPRAEGAATEDARPHTSLAVVGGHETILLVEDNEPVRTITAELLGLLGYHVIAVEHPHQALDLLRTDTPVDLLFSDVVMPGGMDGFRLVDAATAMRPGLKALLASGYAEFSAEEGSTAANVRMLTKPFRQSELARVVREVLEGTMSPTQGVG